MIGLQGRLVHWSDNTPSQLSSYIQLQSSSQIQPGWICCDSTGGTDTLFATDDADVVRPPAAQSQKLWLWSDIMVSVVWGMDTSVKELKQNSATNRRRVCAVWSPAPKPFSDTLFNIFLKRLWAAPSWLLLDLPTLCGLLLAYCHFNKNYTHIVLLKLINICPNCSK